MYTRVLENWYTKRRFYRSTRLKHCRNITTHVLQDLLEICYSLCKLYFLQSVSTFRSINCIIFLCFTASYTVFTILSITYFWKHCLECQSLKFKWLHSNTNMTSSEQYRGEFSCTFRKKSISITARNENM